MKKIALTIIFNLFFLLFPKQSLAHVLVTDNTMGAVIHIDPEDDPIIGQPANFFFEFKNRSNKFDPTQCDCVFKVLEQGKEIYKQELFQNSDQAKVSYIFPKKDLYTIQVIGRPQSHASFQNFTLTYDLRVTREATSKQTTKGWFSTHLIHLSGGILIGLFVLGAFIKQTIDERKRKGVKK